MSLKAGADRYKSERGRWQVITGGTDRVADEPVDDRPKTLADGAARWRKQHPDQTGDDAA